MVWTQRGARIVFQPCRLPAVAVNAHRRQTVDGACSTIRRNCGVLIPPSDAVIWRFCEGIHDSWFHYATSQTGSCQTPFPAHFVRIVVAVAAASCRAWAALDLADESALYTGYRRRRAPPPALRWYGVQLQPQSCRLPCLPSGSPRHDASAQRTPICLRLGTKQDILPFAAIAHPRLAYRPAIRLAADEQPRRL